MGCVGLTRMSADKNRDLWLLILVSVHLNGLEAAGVGGFTSYKDEERLVSRRRTLGVYLRHSMERSRIVSNRKISEFIGLKELICRRGDSNPHELPHTPLKRARLPVPPLRHEVSRALGII